MWKFLIKLMDKWCCKHSWNKYYESQTKNSEHENPYKIEHTLICKNCGKIKKICV